MQEDQKRIEMNKNYKRRQLKSLILKQITIRTFIMQAKG